MLNKVMFFLPSLGGGGAERTVIQLANSFAEQGLKIHLGVCDLNGDKAKLLPEVSSKIKLVNFNCGRVMNSITPLKIKMKAEQYDCLVATQSDEAKNQVYNVALGGRTTLNELYRAIQVALAENDVQFDRDPVYRDFRAGDVRHSQASIAKIEQHLGYVPQYKIAEGIQLAMRWYVNNLK